MARWFGKREATPAPTPAPPVPAPTLAPMRQEVAPRHRTAPTVTPSAVSGFSRGAPVHAWSSRDLRGHHVVGMAHHLDALAGVRDDFKRRGGHVPEWGVEIEGIEAVVVAEPSNKFDPNAVAVWIEGRHHVGYLMSQEAEAYADRLIALAQDGKHLVAPARVWIAQTFTKNDAPASVYVTLPPPTGIEPFNELPEEPHTILPPGNGLRIQVDAVARRVFEIYSLARAARGVAATLHVVGNLVEVRLDGERLGTLTTSGSSKVRDLVAFVASKGRTPVGEVVLAGSELGTEASLYVTRTTEIAQSWLDAVTVTGPPIRPTEAPPAPATLPDMETNVCQQCGKSWERPTSRGRKPHLCPECRD